MLFNDEIKNDLKIAMIKKYGKTSYSQLANELKVSRTSIYQAISNKGSLDKLREKIVEWIHINK